MITQSSIENLKNHLDIVDTVSSYIELKRAGANYKGLCPFHGESTPSFVVSPAKQIYHCFGCGAGGDSLKFTMEYEKLNYPEAIEHLAHANNITLEYEKGSQKKQDTKILDQLKDYYKLNLDTNKSALDYLKDRGVYESSIEEFEIGYAPSSQETINFLNSHFLSINEAIEVGVVGKSNNIFARFIDRIIFPIYTPNAQVTGFGGRTISGHQAKYVNSPQSKVFNKSKLLYGYSKAKENIYKQKEIIITEGYLDVVMLHQAGFKNATASLGTALTKEHLPLIKKGEPRVILAYDGDSAGLNAAYKASIIMATANIDGGVVIFADNQDPADMVKEQKLEELKALFLEPQPFVKYILEFIIKNYDLNNPNAKMQALNEAKAFLSTLPALIANEYKEYLSRLLKIEDKFININHKVIQNNNQNINMLDMAEASIIKTVVEYPHLLNELINSVDIQMFKQLFYEYQLLLNNDFNNPRILNIILNEDVQLFNEDDFFKQLKYFIITFHETMLKNISKEQGLTLNEKTYKIRELREKIRKLKIRV